MDSIAADLEISKRTIYELFRDKDELLLQAIEYWIFSNNKKMFEIVAGSENVIDAIFVIMDHQHRLISSINPMIMDDLKKYFVRLNSFHYANREKCREFSVTWALLERGKKEGIFFQELNPDVVDIFVSEVLNMVHKSDGIKMLHINEKDAFDNIFLPYFRGICTRKGQELIESYKAKIKN